MELGTFGPGDELLLYDGSRAEVLAPSEDGRSIRARYVESPHDPSLVGTEDLIIARMVAAFTPAPPGPEWGERVAVVVYHVSETEESEEGYEAVTMGGVPFGALVTASDAESPYQAVDRLLGALRAFGYSGAVAVEDVTEPGSSERYEIGAVE
ncbi:hypothetical protein GBA65_22095 (plasmid) [Rubrobacter marinus]|uniref:Uncharacterized protein n=1 Tax=Rubrobacter marinus TaxID=2653852 RepID=A0A6G8Q485_9ACTN|nr:hypothetical protein [Rubrobacter marinus]QIN81127.1 hypothetical protein GBA65_22095 [Rubrobacter marinus]